MKTSNKKQKFRGFMIMAEVDGERGSGYFYSRKDKDLVQTINCPVECDEDECQGKSNAVGHSSSEDKSSVTVIWTGPSKFQGEVTFVSTIVGSNDGVSKFWENVRSDPVVL